ncbi:MAG: hypothetical protein QM639_19375 [Rhodocyclaceae bacterium]
MSRRSVCLFALALSMAGASARAEDIAPDSCRSGAFLSEGAVVALYRVASKRPLHFNDDDAGCPAAAGCRRAAYVIGGDELLVSKVQAGWACAWYQGKARETVGWVAADALAPLPEPPVKLSDWIGHWQGAIGAIEIAPGQPGTLDVRGSASWGSGGSVHVGEIGGLIRPQGRHARLGADANACLVDFDRVGRYLIVRDNRRCGGVNVSFDDVYVRK